MGEVPTEEPSVVPTPDPTDLPTFIPTVVPTVVPTEIPTFIPTTVPTTSTTSTTTTMTPTPSLEAPAAEALNMDSDLKTLYTASNVSWSFSNIMPSGMVEVLIMFVVMAICGVVMVHCYNKNKRKREGQFEYAPIGDLEEEEVDDQ